MILKYFIFVDFETAGHHFDYAKNFQSAISSYEIEIQIITLIGLENKFNFNQWKPVIEGGRIRSKPSNKLLQRLFQNLKWVFGDMPRFVRSISSLIEENDSIFIEDFSFSELCAFIFALFLSGKKSLIIAVLIRYTAKSSLIKFILYKAIFLVMRLGFKRVVYFSDSTLLSKSWGKLLNQKVTTLPIPYKLNISDFAKPKRVFWWPGFPRKDKGLFKIINLLKSKNVTEVEFILSSEVKKHLAHPTVKTYFLDPILDTDTYLSMFNKTQYVILPYDRNRYSESTSGIFVESILHGCIPIVEYGTWMARELDKFGLNDLIVDFAYFNLSNFIIDIESNTSHIEIKLKIMQDFYKCHHSLKSFNTQFIGALFNVYP